VPCQLSIEPVLNTSSSLLTPFFYICKRKDRKGRKKKNNNKPRNTIKQTVASAAPEGMHKKRGSLEAKDQLSRQKFFALRLRAAKFPTLALSLDSGQLHHKKKKLAN